MRIGLFFGSFNPVHSGHLIIANYMATQTDLEQVWFVVSPQNPLKKRETLARDRDRLHMVHLAIDDNPLLRTSDVEFSMPKPSYTVDTLIYLREKHPHHQFSLIMGGDNLETIHKWKNYEFLLKEYTIYLYDRPSYNPKAHLVHATVKTFDSPKIDLSSSYIRQCLKKGKSIRYLVPDPVWKYLEFSSTYK